MVEIGKRIIIQIIILVIVSVFITLVVADLLKIKLDKFKLPSSFQPNIVVKIYKDNKKQNSYTVESDENVEGFTVKNKSRGKKKIKQKIKNPFDKNKNKSKNKIEKFIVEEFTNCPIGNNYSKLYKDGIKKLNDTTKPEFLPYNHEDSGYTQTFIK